MTHMTTMGIILMEISDKGPRSFPLSPPRPPQTKVTRIPNYPS
jgi:hypothetical protein